MGQRRSGDDKVARGIDARPAMAFFKERVDEAYAQREVRTSEDAAYYLVQLLTRFVCPSGRLADVGPRPPHPLGGMLLTAAQEHDSYRRFVILRDVGDMSLLLAGFFAESLRQRCVGADYYADLGGAAYGSAAETCQPSANAVVFEELACNFLIFAGVLADVAARCDLADEDTVRGTWSRVVAS
ncbi:MAG: hypothetical protein MPN21_08790 [Thermoanaerobaculia bacterium]|nr:hypothetical protein [Thermoanaerobaculia bacterium]